MGGDPAVTSLAAEHAAFLTARHGTIRDAAVHERPADPHDNPEWLEAKAKIRGDRT